MAAVCASAVTVPLLTASSAQASTGCRSANGVKITDRQVCIGLKFYAGKTIAWDALGVVGNPFDIYARAFAPYLQQFLGANVQITNYPLGNTTMGQDLNAHSVPDGLTIGNLNELSDVASILTNTPGLNFNPSRLAWISSTGPSISVLAVHTGQFGDGITQLSQINSTTPVLTRTSGTINTLTRVFFGVLGITPRYITGYSSSGLEETGFLRGDGPVMVDSSLSVGSYIQGKQAIGLAVNSKPPVGLAYRALLDNLPTFKQIIDAAHLTTAKQKKEVAAFNYLNSSNGTPTVVQTGVPIARVDALRAAFVWMYTQPALKTTLLGGGVSPKVVSPVVAKQTYLQLMKVASRVSGFMQQ